MISTVQPSISDSPALLGGRGHPLPRRCPPQGETAVPSAGATTVLGAARQGRLPLYSVRTAMGRLGASEEQVLAGIEFDGTLIAFNLALVPERCTRRMLMILPFCVENFGRNWAEDLPWADVKRLVCPNEKSILNLPEVAWALGVSVTHTYALLRRGELVAAGNCNCRRGPGGSAQVTRESFLRLLRKRAYPVPIEEDR